MARRDSGFTLLEVLIAVMILAVALTSLLTSQMAAMRATRYARSITTAAFLAEYQLVDVEWVVKQEEDGWGDNDKEYEGDFEDLGWPSYSYKCLVDMVELPEYTQLQSAVDGADDEPQSGVKDTGEQAFDALGMVWPMVKGAIENSVRKVSCTVFWKDGKLEREFMLETYWTDPQKLRQLPSAGGEVGDEDEEGGDDGDPGSGGVPPGGIPGGLPGGN